VVGFGRFMKPPRCNASDAFGISHGKLRARERGINIAAPTQSAQFVVHFLPDSDAVQLLSSAPSAPTTA
jgi:hypothetical protein